MHHPLKRLETRRRHPEELPIEHAPWQIVILGMGRVGVGSYDWFQEKFGHVVSGIDFNPETVAAQLEAGRCVNEGDLMDPDFWRRLPAPQGVVKLVVLALSNLDAMLYAAGKLKEIGYRGDVAAVARYDDEVEALRAAGVNTAFNIYDEAGAGLAAHVCESLETFQK
jgi:Trk K+ transport system NAD-binding subunit